MAFGSSGSLDVAVRFVADTDDIRKGVDNVQSHLGRLGGIAKVAAGAIGGIFVAKQVGDFIGAAEDAEKASARLAKTLENAGDVTGQWDKHAEDLADTLMRSTGIDDELIKGGQAILATFHSVGGQVGQTSGAFDRATKAALDLSKTGFGDVDSAAKQLGKALEDPEKGITALARAGVTFDPIQKQQLKNFVEAGDKAAAMGLVLDVVESQVGGVAEATATSGDKISAAWGEVQEAVGGLLLEAFDRLSPLILSAARYLSEDLGPALQDKVGPAAKKFGQFLNDNVAPALADIGSFIRDTAIPALGDLAQWFVDHQDAFKAFAAPIVEGGAAIVGVIVDTVIPKLSEFAGFLGDTVVPKLQDVANWTSQNKELLTGLGIAAGITAAIILGQLVVALGAWAVAAAVAGGVTLASFLPIILVIVAIALAAALIIESWDTIKETADKVWHFVLDRISEVWQFIVQFWPLLLSILIGPFAFAAAFIIDRWAGLKQFFGAVAPFIANVFSTVFDNLTAPFRIAAQFVLDHWQGILDFFSGLAGHLFDAGKFIVDALIWPWRVAFNAIAKLWNNTVGRIHLDIPDWVPFGLGGKTFAVPPIPEFAAGGIVTSPTLALIGEAGPEAVVPLSRSGGMGSMIVVNVTTTGLGADAPEIGRQVVRALSNHVAGNGLYSLQGITHP